MHKMFTHAQLHVKIMASGEGPSSSSSTRLAELLPLEGAISKVWSHLDSQQVVVKLLKIEKAGTMFIVNFVPKF